MPTLERKRLGDSPAAPRGTLEMQALQRARDHFRQTGLTPEQYGQRWSAGIESWMRKEHPTMQSEKNTALISLGLRPDNAAQSIERFRTRFCNGDQRDIEGFMDALKQDCAPDGFAQRLASVKELLKIFPLDFDTAITEYGNRSQTNLQRTEATTFLPDRLQTDEEIATAVADAKSTAWTSAELDQMEAFEDDLNHKYLAGEITSEQKQRSMPESKRGTLIFRTVNDYRAGLRLCNVDPEAAEKVINHEQTHFDTAMLYDQQYTINPRLVLRLSKEPNGTFKMHPFTQFDRPSGITDDQYKEMMIDILSAPEHLGDELSKHDRKVLEGFLDESQTRRVEPAMAGV